MPNRIIKESALDSEDLAQLSNGAERLFWRLIVVADDFGRFDATPQVVKARCFPRLVDKLRTNEIETWMKELEPKLVHFYNANGRPYGYYLNWSKHQQRRAERSKFPDPPPMPPASLEPHDSSCNHLQSNVSEIENRDRDRDRDNTGPPIVSNDLILPDWLPKIEWDEFTQHRKRKKAPLTRNVSERIILVLDQLRARGFDPAKVLNEAVDRNWTGIKAEWIDKGDNGQRRSEPKGFAGIREILKNHA